MSVVRSVAIASPALRGACSHDAFAAAFATPFDSVVESALATEPIICAASRRASSRATTSRRSQNFSGFSGCSSSSSRAPP